MKARLSSFLGLCLLTQACCSKIYLSNEERLWLSAYQQPQTRTALSADNTVDSIRFSAVKLNPPSGKCNWLEVSNSSSESAEVNYAVYHAGQWLPEKNFIYFDNIWNRKQALPLLRLFNLEFYSDHLQKVEPLATSFGLLLDCYVFDSSNCGPLYSAFKIKRFYFSKSHGLVSYDDTEDKHWQIF